MIYLACILALIVAVPTFLWLKREGEQEWRRHQRQQTLRRLIAQVIVMRESYRSVGVAMRKATAQFNEIAKGFQK